MLEAVYKGINSIELVEKKTPSGKQKISPLSNKRSL